MPALHRAPFSRASELREAFRVGPTIFVHTVQIGVFRTLHTRTRFFTLMWGWVHILSFIALCNGK